MNRVERRRAAKNKKQSEATYTVSRSGLRKITNEVAVEQLKEARAEGMNDALILMLYFPMKVLMDHYWQDSFREKIPDFLDEIFQLYEEWQDEKIPMETIRKELWEVGGVRLEEGEGS